MLDSVDEKRCRNCGNQRASENGFGIWCGKNNMPVHAFNSCGNWVDMYGNPVVKESKPIQDVEVVEEAQLPPLPSSPVEMPLKPTLKLCEAGKSVFNFDGKEYHSFCIPGEVSITLFGNDTQAPEVIFASFKQWWNKRNAVKQK